MAEKNFAALDNVHLVSTAAMPERIAFTTYIPGGMTIRFWIMFSDGEIIRAFADQVVDISIDQVLESFGFSKERQAKFPLWSWKH